MYSKNKPQFRGRETSYEKHGLTAVGIAVPKELADIVKHLCTKRGLSTTHVYASLLVAFAGGDDLDSIDRLFDKYDSILPKNKCKRFGMLDGPKSGRKKKREVKL